MLVDNEEFKDVGSSAAIQSDSRPAAVTGPRPSADTIRRLLSSLLHTFLKSFPRSTRTGLKGESAHPVSSGQKYRHKHCYMIKCKVFVENMTKASVIRTDGMLWRQKHKKYHLEFKVTPVQTVYTSKSLITSSFKSTYGNKVKTRECILLKK